MPTPLSIDGMVEIMRREFTKLPLKTDQQNVLIAISLGGMIAARWLKNHPEDFQRAVLINTSYGDFAPLWKRLKPSAFFKLLKVFTAKGFAKELRILEVVSNRPENYQRVAEHWAQIAEERPVSVPNTFRQLLAASRFTTGGFLPRIPVLVLASTQDRMVDASCSRAIARVWGTPLMEHPSAGHDLSTDEPGWIAEEVRAWLHSLP
jgi:pimeloyl-ACP methyl ester carboxylesterase